MSNINRDYLVVIDVKSGNINKPSMVFYNTDKNTSNIYAQLVIKETIVHATPIENATNYSVELKVIKPENIVKMMTGVLVNEAEAIYEFDLPVDFINVDGTYAIEFWVKAKVADREEVITSSRGKYTVKASILTDLDEAIEDHEDYPLFLKLMEEVKVINETAHELDTTIRTLQADMIDANNEMKTNEATRQANEATRVANEEGRVEAERTRVNQEVAREQAEATREANEQRRIANEDERNVAERQRKANENVRIANEKERKSAEQSRVSTENARANAEEQRQANEANREAAEEIRKANEEARIAEHETFRTEQQAMKTELDEVKAENAVLMENDKKVSDRMTQVEISDKRQYVIMEGLMNSAGDGYLKIEDTGNDTTLYNSIEGFVDVKNITGNTMVNSIKNPDDELTLNGDINTSGQSVTLTTAVDNGQVDVLAEGNTMVNVCDQEEAVAITKSYTVETGNHVALEGDYDGKCRPVVTGNTLVNLIKNGNTSTTITSSSSDYTRAIAKYDYTYSIKSNTDYTIIFKANNIVGLPDYNNFTVSLDGGNTTDSSSTLTSGINIRKVNNSSSNKLSRLWLYFEVGTDTSADISDIVLLEGDYTNKPIPDYFEGMKSSFEDKVVPENLVTTLSSNNLGYYLELSCYTTLSKTFNAGDIITVSFDITNVGTNNNIKLGYGRNNFITVTTTECKRYTVTFDGDGAGGNKVYFYTDSEDTFTIDNVYIVEGDYTNYDFSDYDPTKAGKYRVDYKVTGKNKININKLNNDKQNISIDDNKVTLSPNGAFTAGAYYKLKLKTDNQYTLSCNKSIDETFSYIQIECLDINDSILLDTRSYGTPVTFVAPNNTEEIKITVSNGNYTEGTVTFTNIQLEEGSTATAYEPYKESIKTYYLNSPLLEGDTIEESGGNVYHVHRSKQEIFNGDETFTKHPNETNNTLMFTCVRNNAYDDKNAEYCYSDKFISKRVYNEDNEGFYSGSDLICFRILKSKLPSEDVNGFKSYISQNPTTVVYKLSSPQYELISQSDTILTDSYVAGHLDFDTAVPVEKVSFKGVWLALKYWYPSTEYNIQFESDNIGKLDLININGSYISGNVVKGINKFTLTTPSSVINNNMDMRGIGFSASNIVVTEATDKEFGYFAGMKSVGELEENKIEILSSNKNLLCPFNSAEDLDNCKYLTKGASIHGLSISNNSIIIDTSNWNSQSLARMNHKLCNLKPNTKYTLSCKVTGLLSGRIYAFFVNSILYTDLDSEGNWSQTFTTDNLGSPLGMGDKYSFSLLGSYATYEDTVIISNIQLVEGDAVSNYVVPANNKKQILLNEPLRAVGDAKDRFVQIDGKWYVERNCAERNYETDDETNTSYKTDKVKTVYTLASPTYEPVEIFPTVNTYTDVTHITNNSTIPMNMNIKNSGYEVIAKPSTKYTVVGMTNGRIGDSTIVNGTITTPATLDDPFLRPYGTGKTSKVMLLEGEPANIPGYFTGIKSSFEDKVTEDGKYVVEVKVVGKNKFDINSVVNKYSNGISKIDNGIRVTNGVYDLTEILNIDANKQYTLSWNCEQVSGEGRSGFEFVYSDGTDNYRGNVGDNVLNSFSGKKISRVMITYSTSGTTNLTNIQLEEGTVATEYEPYQETKQTLYLDEPLYNTNKMCIYNDKLGYWKNWDSITYDGSEDENITIHNHTTFKDRISFRLLTNYNVNINTHVYSNTFNSYKFDELFTVNSNKEGVCSHNTNANQNAYLFIKRTKLPTQDLAGFKQYLSQNPLTIVYQLAEPIFVPLIDNCPNWVIGSWDNCSIHFDSIIPLLATRYRYTGNVPSVMAMRDDVATTKSISDEQDALLVDMATELAVMKLTM